MPKALTTAALYKTERLVGREKALFLLLANAVGALIVSVVASDGRSIFGHICGAHSLHYDDANLALLMENLTGDSWSEDPKAARRAFVKGQGGNRIQEVSYTRKGFIPIGWASAHEDYNAPEAVASFGGTFGKVPAPRKAKTPKAAK